MTLLVSIVVRTSSWNDLITYVRGGGIVPGYYARLPFDGRTYPENPTIPPAQPLRKRVEGTAYMSDWGRTDAGVQHH